MGRLSVYTGKALQVMESLKGELRSYIPNKVYYNPKYQTYFYINTKGYLHVLTPTRISFNGNERYQIKDSLLSNRNNTFETITLYGNFNSYDECIKELSKDAWI